MKKNYVSPALDQMMLLSSDVITASVGMTKEFSFKEVGDDFGVDEVTF